MQDLSIDQLKQQVIDTELRITGVKLKITGAQRQIADYELKLTSLQSQLTQLGYIEPLPVLTYTHISTYNDRKTPFSLVKCLAELCESRVDYIRDQIPKAESMNEYKVLELAKTKGTLFYTVALRQDNLKVKARKCVIAILYNAVNCGITTPDIADSDIGIAKSPILIPESDIRTYVLWYGKYASGSVNLLLSGLDMYLNGYDKQSVMTHLQ